MAGEQPFPHASVIEGVRFTVQVGAPSVLRGLFHSRDIPNRAANAVRVDERAYALIAGLVRSHGPGPFYVRVGTGNSLLVTDPDDIRFVLDGSPDPFTSNPEAKTKGMTAFQPDALTLSTGTTWRARRDFAESVLDTGLPVHRLVDVFVAKAAEEAGRLTPRSSWREFNDVFRRLTRRVLFGDTATSDTALSTMLSSMMAKGNGLPGTPDARYPGYLEMIHTYLDDPAADSLAGLVSQTPIADGTDPAGQMIHWLFAMGDTLAANVLRALGALAFHPSELARVHEEIDGADLTEAGDVAALSRTAGALQEAMRLWPTTPMFGRVAARDVEFPGGATVPAGTEVLINNLFNHRNRERIAYADAFSPDEWIGGDAASSWAYNFFSHGPQVCPGAGLAVVLGQAVMAALLASASPMMTGIELDPGAMPYTFDIESIKLELSPRERSGK